MIYSKKNIQKFFISKVLIIAILLTVINVFLVECLFTDNVIKKTFSDKISGSVISKALIIKQQYSWFIYILTPVLLILKMLLVTFCFWIGSLFEEAKIKFRNFFNVVIISEFVFIIFNFIKTGLLYCFKFQTITEINQFHPFTLFSILNKTKIPEYLYYSFTIISVQEITYWIILTLLLKSLLRINFIGRILFIAKTYGIGMLIWMSIVAFFTIIIMT
jgi:hypothetical protein